MQLKLVTGILLCLIIPFNQVFSQEKKVAKEIDIVISAAREGKMIMPGDLIFREENIGLTLNEVGSFVADSNALVRNQSYMIINKAGRSAKSNSEISTSVELLAGGCHDQNPGIVRYCSKSLQNFPRRYFSGKSKEYIRTALYPGSRTLPNIALMIGYLNLQESAGTLQRIANNKSESRKNKWYANLALARMGYQPSVKYCLNVYKNQALNSKLVDNMVPELLYTRQKEIYDKVVKLLYSDEKNCLSGNPDNERSIPCGYLVMELLSPYIEGFPLETHASGAIKSGDYDQALEELRTWFRNNQDYKIKDSGF